ncbi:MAG TPA: hypothetical protein VFO85_13110 [Vicinamibacteria bacterium]|nr:hypothetical protein [Vicinamibacteria bacterium]
MQRPSEREFLQAVLRDLPDLPQGLAERLLEIVAAGPLAGDRSEAIRKIFEDAARG